MPANGQQSYIATKSEMEGLVWRLASAPCVALDTEADSLHHYFEKVCLIQISVGGEHFIVDPLAGIDLAPLIDALRRCRIILHGADYDLRMMSRDFGFRASEVFDTMIAAQLLGLQKVSLAALVERHHGIVLSKHGQKADWSRRPLPAELIEYAYNDTRYLASITEQLTAELALAGRLEWHTEVCRELVTTATDSAQQELDPDRLWRVKGWHSLKTKRGQAILRELWHWRDQEAQRADLPSFKVLGNEPLVALAAWADQNEGFSNLPRLPRNCVGRRLRALRDAVSRARKMSQGDYPGPLPIRKRENYPDSEHIAVALKKLRDDTAKELLLDPGVLLPGATLSLVAKIRPGTLEELQKAGNLYDWQVKLMGAQLLETIRTAAANPPKPGERGRRGESARRKEARKPSTAESQEPVK